MRSTIARGSSKRAGGGPRRIGPLCLCALALTCTNSPTGGQPGDPNILIRDTFSRVTSEGWGVADVGGRWYMNVGGPIFRVDGHNGIIELPNNIGPQNVVGRGTGGYGKDVVGLISFSVDRAPDAPRETHHVQVYARRDDRVGDGDYYYRYRVRIFGDKEMDVRIEKNIGIGPIASWLTEPITLDMTFSPGAKYWIRWEAFGKSPATTVRMRVWRDGDPEPLEWHASAVVDEPRLDVSGTTGVRFQGPVAGQLNWPLRLVVDDLEYVKLQQQPQP